MPFPMRKVGDGVWKGIGGDAPPHGQNQHSSLLLPTTNALSYLVSICITEKVE